MPTKQNANQTKCQPDKMLTKQLNKTLFCRDTSKYGSFCRKLLKSALRAKKMAVSALRADSTLSPTLISTKQQLQQNISTSTKLKLQNIDPVSDLMHNWVAQTPNFKSALRVVKMVLDTQCYQYLWLSMWFHAKKSKETLKNSKSLILQCKFGNFDFLSVSLDCFGMKSHCRP